ncbi:Cytosolic sulfotransferase 3 [Carex littledalei]|uniref:Sulfotransferase n=1 Tax=Carex littledalei TaxID=544730 RepID=A0A833QGY2_9POAL|nr:Cytosolic sulfotransferase 3 [Carex littledalei]
MPSNYFRVGRSLAGPIWDHVLEYWNESLKRPDKILFLRYKEMLADPLGSVKRVADFTGHPFMEEEKKGRSRRENCRPVQLYEINKFKCEQEARIKKVVSLI